MPVARTTTSGWRLQRGEWGRVCVRSCRRQRCCDMRVCCRRGKSAQPRSLGPTVSIAFATGRRFGLERRHGTTRGVVWEKQDGPGFVARTGLAMRNPVFALQLERWNATGPPFLKRSQGRNGRDPGRDSPAEPATATDGFSAPARVEGCESRGRNGRVGDVERQKTSNPGRDVRWTRARRWFYWLAAR